MGNRGVTARVAVKEQPCICPVDRAEVTQLLLEPFCQTGARFCPFFFFFLNSCLKYLISLSQTLLRVVEHLFANGVRK